MTTIIDVAKLAGVSKSTVSRVTSGKGYVSEEARAKILQAMQALDYSPNTVARNLQRGSTKNIGFLVPRSSKDIFASFLNSFILTARQFGYFVTIYFTDNDKQRELDALDQMRFKQLDGMFILTRTNDWALIEPYSAYGPIATWQRVTSHAIHSVYVDHYDGYLLTLDYLYARGYRSFGHIFGTKKNLNTKARIKAIEDFYAAHDLPLTDLWMVTDVFESHGGRKLAHEWRALPKPPEAVAFFTDSVACGFLSEAQLLGIRVPEDVAIIGFDNSEMSELMHVTTVDYTLEQQARNAFIYIYNQLNGTVVAEESITFQLIERQSVGQKSSSNDNDYK